MVRENISYQAIHIEISYPNKDFYNNLTMKIIVLESITLNPNNYGSYIIIRTNGTKSFIV